MQAVSRQLVDQLTEQRGVAMQSVGNPVAVHFGVSALDDLRALVQPPVFVISTRRALADPTVAGRLATLGVAASWTDVRPNPPPQAVTRAHAAATAVRPGTIVGLGGGSVLDVAKMTAAFLDVAAVSLRSPPTGLTRRVRLIQIPTTAGTGSEVTRWASYWMASGEKLSFDNSACWADAAIIDPALSSGMPPRTSLATGLDALAHAVESLWGRAHTPASDAMASAALGLIAHHLPNAITCPSPSDREAMAMAALLAGLALSRCESAAAHALSYGLTGRFGIEHGIAVGLMCRGLLRVVAERSRESVDVVLDALGLATVEQAETFIDRLMESASVRPSLSALGVPRSAWPGLVSDALRSNRLANQPGEWDHDDLIDVLGRVA